MRIGLQQALTSKLRLNLTSSCRRRLPSVHNTLRSRYAFHSSSYKRARPDTLPTTHHAGVQGANSVQAHSTSEEKEDVKYGEQAFTNKVKPIQKTTASVASVDRKNIDAWIALLEPALPAELRNPDTDISNTNIPTTEDVLKIFARARSIENAGIDIFTYLLVQKDRQRAVLYLVEMLLKSCVNNTVTNFELAPSNIQWPLDSFLTNLKSLQSLQVLHQPDIDLEEEYGSNSNAASSSQMKTRVMEEIWLSVGRVIIEAANIPHEDTARVLTTVYKILAYIHSQNLLPGNVYSYSSMAYSSAVQKPPILHLLSARILTTLSDAVWRSQSDDLISKTASLGVSYKDIGKDPPGGRFRLKVRELGPEIWLEFVLWCCIEGGYASAGANIVDTLNYQTQDPWFALHWTSNDYTRSAVKTIDWDRVKSRHGGTVGLIEGYNREKPFVELPPRTISAEVVLALVESLLNKTGTADYTAQVVRLRKQIRNVVSFLEPHYLPVQYFDYLSVRVLQADVKINDWSSEFLDEWSQTMAYVRHLETVEPRQVLSANFSHDNILAQSEVQSGISHQVLSAYVEACDVVQSVETFAKIQNNVDGSKLHAIGSFLSQPGVQPGGFFSSPIMQTSLDFTGSHGQLPMYEIAAFLNLVTDNNLVRLGEWLLYTEDIDGPVISPSTYANSCLATALIRFTAVSGDDQMLSHINKVRRSQKLKPSVNFLRALVNANIQLHDFDGAADHLFQLTKAQGGGYGPSNLANLAALILRLESNNINPERYVIKTLEKAKLLLHQIMQGRYNSTRGEYTILQNMIYRRQIGHLLRLFDNLPSKTLNQVAEIYWDKFPISNDTGLVVSAFNIVLDAFVEVKGSAEGRKLWDLFCQDPLLSRNRSNIPLSGDEDVLETDEEGIPMEGSTATADTLKQRNSQTQAYPGQAYHKNETSDHGRRGLSSKTVAGTNPIVAPDIRTLRIIVRAAIDEKRRLAEDKSDAKQQKTLRWATHLYKALGSSRRAIEQEIQQSLVGESDDNDDKTVGSLSSDDLELRLRERRPVSILRNFRPMGT